MDKLIDIAINGITGCLLLVVFAAAWRGALRRRQELQAIEPCFDDAREPMFFEMDDWA